jgi:hypothetical protein
MGSWLPCPAAPRLTLSWLTLSWLTLSADSASRVARIGAASAIRGVLSAHVDDEEAEQSGEREQRPRVLPASRPARPRPVFLLERRLGWLAGVVHASSTPD